MSPLSLHDRMADYAAKLATVGQARAAIGAGTVALHRAYEVADDVGALGGVQDAVRSLLDQANDYAQRVYGELTGDEARLLDPQELERVSLALAQIAQAIEMAIEAFDSTTLTAYAETWLQSLAQVTNAAGGGLFNITGAAAIALWPLVLVGLVVLFAVWKARTA